MPTLLAVRDDATLAHIRPSGDLPNIPPGFDLTDPDACTTRLPDEELAELRRTAPVWWVAQRRGSAGFDDEGYWAITRHADIVAVSRTPGVYSSSENCALIRHPEGTPREAIDIQRIMLLNMDPPEHTKLRGLSDDEFGFFVLMLAVAGNETTRNAIAHGMLAFLDHPDQWELFKAARPDTAADEIVRWATPVMAFQRTATQDTILGGQHIRAGQRVGLFYRSANFDEEVFDHPERFDIRRSPNPHLGYGGYGAHYCLGANLAKLEIELIFNAIADAMPDIAKAGEEVRLRSGWINGIKDLPVSYRT